MAKDTLGGEDATWLHTERPTNPMVVNAMVELDQKIPLDRVHQVVERLASTPRFKSRVIEPTKRFGRPTFEPDPGFDLGRHVEHIELGTTSDASLRELIDGLVSTPLDFARPLWRVHVIDRPGTGTTLLFRAHHALGDGFALLGVLLSLCDAGPDGADRATPPRARVPGGPIAAAKALGHLVLLPPDPRTLLKGKLGTTKHVAWSEPLALSDVKAAAHLAGATVNDVLVALTAGAIGRYLARRGDRTAGLEIRAMMPVNLRPGGSTASLGNRFGLVLPSLPLGIGDPLARIAAVRESIERIKHTPEAAVAHGLLRTFGLMPRAVEDLAVAFFVSKTSLVLTNLPGPAAPLSLGGSRIARLMFWVPQAGRMGLGISILSYAGKVTIGVISDTSLIPDPDRLVDDLHAEFATLEAHVRAEQRAGAGPGPEQAHHR